MRASSAKRARHHDHQEDVMMKRNIFSVTLAGSLLLGASAASAQNINFDGANFPCISYNISTAQTAGHPNALTRTTNAQTIAANRQASCGPAAVTVAALNRAGGAGVREQRAGRRACGVLPPAQHRQWRWVYGIDVERSACGRRAWPADHRGAGWRLLPVPLLKRVEL